MNTSRILENVGVQRNRKCIYSVLRPVLVVAVVLFHSLVSVKTNLHVYHIRNQGMV